MAWIKVRNGHELTEEQVDRFCRGQIATCKIPRYWKFVDDFPMTVSGKIRKVEMRKISTKELGLEGVARIETA
jgi:fatty-acyl-CoA synthase